MRSTYAGIQSSIRSITNELSQYEPEKLEIAIQNKQRIEKSELEDKVHCKEAELTELMLRQRQYNMEVIII